MSFSTGGNVSKVQGEDLMALMMASSERCCWTIANTSLLLNGVMSVSPDIALANEGVSRSNNPIATGRNGLFTADSFLSTRRQPWTDLSQRLIWTRSDHQVEAMNMPARARGISPC